MRSKSRAFTLSPVLKATPKLLPLILVGVRLTNC